MTEVEAAPSQRPPAESRRRRLPRGFPVFAIVGLAIVAFLLGGIGGSYQSKLNQVQKNENSDYLPGSAESTKVANESTAFLKVESIPGFVVYQRSAGLTDADLAVINKGFAAIKALPGVDRAQLTAPEISLDKTTASIYVPLTAKESGKAVDFKGLADNEKRIVATAQAQTPAGLTTLPAGPGGLITAFFDAFSGLDSALLIAVFLVVVLILLIVYRSPILWMFPLISAFLALGMASMILYELAKHDVLTLTGQSQGIVSVLVLGAGTDYALLLISRYREELHEYPNRFDAMITAWRESAPAIVASAVTVIVGLLCLSFSELNSNKSLGPVAAVGIACTLFMMMTFLPVALSVIGGRWVFWPRRPLPDHAVDLATHGIWGRAADLIGRRYRYAWIGATAILLLCLIGLGSLKTNGLTTAQSFTGTPDAVKGQRIYDAKFDKGAGAPAVITTRADKAAEVIAAAAKVPGVSTKPGSVCPQIDYGKLPAAGSGRAVALIGSGCAPAALQVTAINGRTLVNATLADSYDSQNAYDTIKRLRTAVHAVPGADARVGGQTAATLDVQTASVHDRNLIIPIVLLVIWLVLSLLLRALVVPLLLISTVVLSFLATLGVCGFVFDHAFGFAGADQSFPLFAFVFLVALGIDYNIFLMTRVREETLQFGTRRGILRGLAVTGGVITSAGIVLAATFAVLGVLPLVAFAEIGFSVAFGVLLDTVLVRSILVPALSIEIGRPIWWPSSLARGEP
ncbi:MAG: MMPL family transporter [Jatrophihabitantaceae bacterium]